jgi:hypothetical protein
LKCKSIGMFICDLSLHHNLSYCNISPGKNERG